MANYGNSEQHAKAGQQSHKNSDSGSSKNQQMNATAWGQNDSGQDRQQTQRSAGTQGGTHEQHVKAGQQSHKNS